jgi:hypothetical protein
MLWKWKKKKKKKKKQKKKVTDDENKLGNSIKVTWLTLYFKDFTKETYTILLYHCYVCMFIIPYLSYLYFTSIKLILSIWNVQFPLQSSVNQDRGRLPWLTVPREITWAKKNRVWGKFY